MKNIAQNIKRNIEIKLRVKVAVGERNAGCQAGERNICPQDSTAPLPFNSSSSRHLFLMTFQEH